MVLELEAYQAIGLVLTILGSIVGFGKAFLSRIEISIHERDNTLEQSLNSLSGKMDRQDNSIRDIERDLLMLKAELPEKYINKSDFNRTFTVVDAKLDRLYGIISQSNKDNK